MSLIDAYTMAHTAQSRLDLAARRPDRNLRMVVGHLMHYESLRLRIVAIEEAREQELEREFCPTRRQSKRQRRNCCPHRQSSGAQESWDEDDSAEIVHMEKVEMVETVEEVEDVEDEYDAEATASEGEYDDFEDDDDFWDDEDADSEDLSLSRFPSGSAHSPPIEEHVEPQYFPSTADSSPTATTTPEPSYFSSAPLPLTQSSSSRSSETSSSLHPPGLEPDTSPTSSDDEYDSEEHDLRHSYIPASSTVTTAPRPKILAHPELLAHKPETPEFHPLYNDSNGRRVECFWEKEAHTAMRRPMVLV